MTEKQKQYHAFLGEALKGRTLEKVLYAGQQDVEDREVSQAIHSVDQYLILALDNGRLFQIRWEDAFFEDCYGIGGAYLAQIPHRADARVIDMSGHAAWKKMLHQRILELVVYWDIDQARKHTYRNAQKTKTERFEITIPHTLELRFASGQQLWIAALETWADGRAGRWDDHLTIFFSKPAVEQYEQITEAHFQYRI